MVPPSQNYLPLLQNLKTPAAPPPGLNQTSNDDLAAIICSESSQILRLSGEIRMSASSAVTSCVLP